MTTPRLVVTGILIFLAGVSNAVALSTRIELTSDSLGLGSSDINHGSNGSAVEKDIVSKLVTSSVRNTGSILYIQTNNLAGQGDIENPLMVTVTSHTHTDTTVGLPAGYDFQGGVITLTKNDNNISKEGLVVRSFGIDIQSGSSRYLKRSGSKTIYSVKRMELLY